MTIYGKNSNGVRKESNNLQLTGSKICLTPRKSIISTATWSDGKITSYPVTRSVSASPTVGTRQGDKKLFIEKLKRPYSADNLARRYSFSNHTESYNLNYDDLIQNCSPNVSQANILENMINEQAELTSTTHHDLEPGLLGKPPLPPPPGADIKNSALKIIPDNNLNNPDKDTLDEIVALKFQRWFPNSQPIIQESEFEDPSASTEILSFREHTYQTCEYTYEVSTKNLSNKNRSNFRKPPLNPNRKPNSLNENPRKNKLRLFLPTGDKKSENVNASTNEEDLEIFALPDIDRKIDSKNQDEIFLEHHQSVVEEKEIAPNSAKNNHQETRKKSPNYEQFSKKKIEPNNDLSETKLVAKCENSKNVKSRNNNCLEISRSLSPQFSDMPKTDEISWMGKNIGNQHLGQIKNNQISIDKDDSIYNEIADILKVIETEQQEIDTGSTDVGQDIQREPPALCRSGNVTVPLTSAKDIWNLLDEAEHNNDTSVASFEAPKFRPLSANHNSEKLSNRDGKEDSSVRTCNRLSDLLRLPSAELAQKVLALQLILEEKDIMTHNLTTRCRNSENLLNQRNQEVENNNKKMQKTILALKEEKRNIREEFDNTVKALEKKQEAAQRLLEEKFALDLKKMQEKQAAADKVQRDRWMESKTQRIKELAIKGLEPELNRMVSAHQEEISDMRRFHQRQLQELEESWGRKMSVLKEKLEADKEKSLAIEREMSRQKLEEEIGELEKRYQEQRKRLLAEVHIERENIERESDATLAVKEKEAHKKWEKKAFEMQKKVEDIQTKHQEDIEKLRVSLESEKQTWKKQQLIELVEKENKMKEQCKKERDKHIEMIIQKLENETYEKDRNSDAKFKRMKEQFEIEVKDLEQTVDTLRRKLNESRSDVQTYEETISQMRAQLQQNQTELSIIKEKSDRSSQEQVEMQNLAKSETTIKISILQSELNQMQLTYQSQIKSLKSEHERELSQVYNRVKEMVLKKDDLINNLKNEKDAALQQCCQLEKLLDQRRKTQLL